MARKKVTAEIAAPLPGKTPPEMAHGQGEGDAGLQASDVGSEGQGDAAGVPPPAPAAAAPLTREQIEEQFPVGARVWVVVPDAPVQQWTRGNVDSYGLDMADELVVWVSCGMLPDNHPVAFRPDQIQVLP